MYPEKHRDKELGWACRGQRAPPSFSLWLNADFFKRIVHRLANLPAASTAEHDGAYVVRVTCLCTCYQNHREGAPLHKFRNSLVHSFLHSLATAWSPISVQSEAHSLEDAPNAYFKMKCYYFLSWL